MRIVSVTGWPDIATDLESRHRQYDSPINRYAICCTSCQFPDIDSTPIPYLLLKKSLRCNLEIYPANLGNLLVSDRVKEILSLIFPAQLTYNKTLCENSTVGTQWWHATVHHTVRTAEIQDSIPRCRECSEPLHWHPSTQSKYWRTDLESDFDIAKSSNWHSISTTDWKKTWINRDLLFSKRLLELLKLLKINCICQHAHSASKKPNPDEVLWAKKQFTRLPEKLRSPQPQAQSEQDKGKIITFLRQYCDHKVSGLNSLTFPFHCEILDQLQQLQDPSALWEHSGLLFALPSHWRIQQDYRYHYAMKMIRFAADDFGNNYLFDAGSKEYPVYYYDHDTGTTHQAYGNLWNFFLCIMQGELPSPRSATYSTPARSTRRPERSNSTGEAKGRIPLDIAL